MIVACVLRSGGEYGPDHVAALRSGVRRHIGRPHRFVCLSDVDVPCERICLRHDWPGWFAKMELFDRSRLAGDVVYFDLDTVFVGGFGDMLDGHRFTALRDFMMPGIGSAIMAWSIDLSAIYQAFRADPWEMMAQARHGGCWGDQGLIKLLSPVGIDHWQDRHPGRIVSYKVDKVAERGVPVTASIVCFHGHPRPWHTSLWHPE